MTEKRCVSTFIGVVLMALAMGGCSSDPPPTTVQMQADYPSYDERSLVAEATTIVEGTVLATESTVLTPRYEGDTPEENPLFGLSEEEKEQALEQDDGVPATAVTMRVDVSHRGSPQPDQEIIIFQTGGVVGNVEYTVAAEPILTVGESYLLFATDSFDDAFVILGGSAGTYLATGDGDFSALNPSLAPFQQLDRDDVAALVQ
ncbi:MAG: hypothetical protein Q4P15_12835 [Propionibacteriaceae bacterium]|nr:hypothetical protein [Propionibacteriaceae bacterium]